ncbi:MAG: TIGR03086 family metal-binding protein [Nocardioides sp.]
MTGGPPGPAVELLERALAYTRGALLTVTPAHLARRTPCAAWNLDQLLAHMDDALDAFTEASSGTLSSDVEMTLATRIDVLQVKACSLLGAWASATAPATVTIDGLDVPTEVLVVTAALEITVHGWDVGAATGRGQPIPPALATALLPAARMLVDEGDRGLRFATPIPFENGAPGDVQLLAWCGRDLTGPPGGVSLVHTLGARSAS